MVIELIHFCLIFVLFFLALISVVYMIYLPVQVREIKYNKWNVPKDFNKFLSVWKPILYSLIMFFVKIWFVALYFLITLIIYHVFF